jgi:hypothetical protein
MKGSKMKPNILHTILGTLILAGSLYAVPAYQGEISFKQQDGSAFNGTLKGDEWFHWIEDNNGHVIVYNRKNKTYEFGMLKLINGSYELLPSGIAVVSQNKKYENRTLPVNVGNIDHNTLSQIWKNKRNKALRHMED